MSSESNSITTAARLGARAGFAVGRVEPAVDLAAQCALNYGALECLAERTIALTQQERTKDPDKGFERMFDARRCHSSDLSSLEAGHLIDTVEQNTDLANAFLVAESVCEVLQAGSPKVSVAYPEGFVGEGEIPGARARLADQIVKARMAQNGVEHEELKLVRVGVNLLHEVRSLCTNGPAGDGSVSQSTSELLAVQSVLTPRYQVSISVKVL